MLISAENGRLHPTPPDSPIRRLHTRILRRRPRSDNAKPCQIVGLASQAPTSRFDRGANGRHFALEIGRRNTHLRFFRDGSWNTVTVAITFGTPPSTP